MKVVTRENVIVKGPYLRPHLDGALWVLLSPEFPHNIYREYQIFISNKEFSEQKRISDFASLLNTKIEMGVVALNEII